MRFAVSIFGKLPPVHTRFTQGSHNAIQAQAIAVELAQLGYRIRNLNQFTAIERTDFEQRLEILKHRRGDTVNYVPLFTNFPDDLPNDHEYLLKRILPFLALVDSMNSDLVQIQPSKCSVKTCGKKRSTYKPYGSAMLKTYFTVGITRS